MGITKRRLEAEESDYNEEMRLCASCGERIEFEDDPSVISVRFEHSITGPFTTIWHCGCRPIIPGKCVRCSASTSGEEVPLCDDCLMDYEEEIAEKVGSLKCARCGCGIPKGEIDLYFESGMCGWCDHMTGKIEMEDQDNWSPEKDLQPDVTRTITPEEFLSRKVDLVTDPRLIRYLAEHPSDIFSLSPREFEEFIAELLRKMGYKTKIGPRGRDGGVDVFAEQDRDIGPELVLVQCKRFDPSQRVSQPIVKQLLADVFDRRASHGLVVTTSTFSRPALQYIDERKYVLSGADFEKLEQWLGKFKIGL